MSRSNRNLAATVALAALAALAAATLVGNAAGGPDDDPGANPAGDSIGQGELRALGDGEHAGDVFPLEHTRVEARIDGKVSRVSVTQVFANPYDDTIEAIYVFPLPQNAAVDDMLMQVGERTIRGTIMKREEARQVYEAAKQAGHVASLLDQERPNIFTQSVANILPGNRIEITIRYVETLQPEHGLFSFVFPMVVGPRFIPGAPVAADPHLLAGEPGSAGGTPEQTQPPQRSQPPQRPAPDDGGPLAPTDRSGTGWSPDTDLVPDASRITPPVLRPGQRSGHDIELALALDGGMPIRDLASPSHAIDVERPDASHARVSLRPFDTIPNRDFVLEYRLAGEQPELAVLPYRAAAGADEQQQPGYFTALLAPAAHPAASDIMPKEMIFVVDCSGSMSGEPIAKARQAMRHALKNLDPRDSFQIIRFSTQASGLSPRPLPATPDNVRRGLRYIERLAGQGGTMMIEGIKAALDYPADPERLRIVAFMTDGYIGNETQILTAIQERLGGARLFSFGVGSSVNRYLLERMAEVGRGAMETVLLGSDTQEVVERFYERVRSPYLTDITIDWGGLAVEDLYPERLPDLFAGQTLALAGRYTRPGRGTVTVRGRLGGRPWERSFAIELPAATRGGGEAIASVWARARIRDLTARQYGGEQPAIVEQITELALAHRLMTRYTSFVAVEERIEVVGGEPRTVTVPVEMPEGVSYEGVFGKDVVGEAALLMRGGYGTYHYGGGVSGPAPSRAMTAMPINGLACRIDKAPAAAGDFDQNGDADLFVLPGASPVASSDSLEVQLRAPRTALRAGERVQLTVEITNRSSSERSLPWPLAAGPGGIELAIIDGQWHEVPFVPFVPFRETSGSGDGNAASRPTGLRTLAPGETVTVTVELIAARAGGAGDRQPAAAAPLRGYLLPGPGRYHVGVLRAGGMRVESNRILIEVRS